MKLDLLSQANLTTSNRASRLRRWNRLILIWSVTLFGLLLLVVGGQFLYVNFRKQSLTNEASSLLATFNSRSGEVVEYIRVKQSLVEAGKIIGTRTNYQKILGEIFAVLPDGVFMTDADFLAGDILDFSGRAVGVGAYERFLEGLESRAGREGFLFSEVVQTQLVRQRNGSYQFNLQLKIADGSKEV